MNGSFSTPVLQSWMDDMESRTKWLALVSANPMTASDPLAVEIIGTVYARQLGIWVRTSPTLLTLDSAVVWTNLVPGTVVAGVAGFDAEFNGNLLFADLLIDPLNYPNGGAYALPSGQYVLGLDL